MNTQDTIAVPKWWLAQVSSLLNEMAGEGVFMSGFDDPAILMADLAEYFGLSDADDPWREVIEKLAKTDESGTT